MFNYDYEEQLFKNSELYFTLSCDFDRFYHRNTTFKCNNIDIDISTYKSVIGLLYNEKYYYDFKETKIKPFNLYKILITKTSYCVYKNFDNFLNCFQSKSIEYYPKDDCEWFNLLKLVSKNRPEILI